MGVYVQPPVVPGSAGSGSGSRSRSGSGIGSGSGPGSSSVSAVAVAVAPSAPTVPVFLRRLRPPREPRRVRFFVGVVVGELPVGHVDDRRGHGRLVGRGRLVRLGTWYLLVAFGSWYLLGGLRRRRLPLAVPAAARAAARLLLHGNRGFTEQCPVRVGLLGLLLLLGLRLHDGVGGLRLHLILDLLRGRPARPRRALRLG